VSAANVKAQSAGRSHKKPASETPWTRKLWIYDLRTNMHFTLKTNPLKREDLEEFVKCFNPGNRHERKPRRSDVRSAHPHPGPCILIFMFDRKGNGTVALAQVSCPQVQGGGSRWWCCENLHSPLTLGDIDLVGEHWACRLLRSLPSPDSYLSSNSYLARMGNDERDF
jgi:hypothetical protein